MAPSGCERLRTRRSGRSTLASGWPERVAQVRTRRTATPGVAAGDDEILYLLRAVNRYCVRQLERANAHPSTRPAEL